MIGLGILLSVLFMFFVYTCVLYYKFQAICISFLNRSTKLVMALFLEYQNRVFV